jgi:secreted protein with Ig-like and vWFA domain
MNDELKSKLTAWALDELPADERARLEAGMSAEPDVRRYANETREFCTVLSRAIGSPPDTALTEDQREHLVQQLAEPAAEKIRRIPAAVTRTLWSLAAAAVVVAIALVAENWNRPRPDDFVIANQRNAPAPVAVEETLALKPDSQDALSRRAHAPLGPESSTAAAPDRDLAALSSQLADVGESFATQGATLPTTESAPDGVRKPEALAAAAGTLASNAPAPGGGADGTAPSRSVRLGADPVSSSRLNSDSLAATAAAPTPPAPAPVATPLAPAAERPASTPLVAGVESFGGASRHVIPADSGAVRGGESAGNVNDKLDRYRALITKWHEAQRAMGDAAISGELREQKLREREDLAREVRLVERELDEFRQRREAGLTRRIAQLSPADPATPAAEAARKLREPSAPPDRSDLHFYEQGLGVRPTAPPAPDTESYEAPPENPFQSTAAEPLSTFSIDVDTASYANVRRFLNQGQRPPKAAVRLEELINYFSYDYAQPVDGQPFSVTVDLAECPWNPVHRLARIGLKGREVAPEIRPASNLVFLVDVSGSMQEPNKLPLVKQSLSLLVEKLGENDRVAMVTYAGSSGLALDSTTGDKKQTILPAIDRLEAGGSTHGSAGIQQAYEVAVAHFIKGGVNRVILLTDGDFNVGLTDREALNKLIVEKASSGVFLSVLGYGMGNLKDATMEMLADKGNGNYAYIDSLGEARKVLSEQINSTLVTIARDVKVQIEFNPAVVRSYRLVGYENRILAKEDFNDDKKDAGEIGAGHSVTALYELVPVGAPPETPPVDPLKYQPKPLDAPAPAPDSPLSRESMTVKLRYKAPDGDQSQLIEVPVVDEGERLGERRVDFKFAAGVAAFGMLLKDSNYKGSATWELVRQLALEGKGADPLGYRGEFIQLVDRARGVAPPP